MGEKIKLIIYVALAMLTIIGTSYSGFKFYSCKADKVDVNTAMVNLEQAKADRAELELVRADLYIYKLQQRRKYVQERIWDIQRQFPSNYMNNQEYRDLVQELRRLDIEINAYYQKGRK